MAVTPAVDKAGRRGRLVVVVDDDDGVREVCADALLGAGYRVLPFARGDDALRVLAAAVAAVLVVDWQMPGLDGAEVALRARLLDPGLPVLMITGSPEHAAAAAGRAGVRHILTKPFDLAQLVDAVAALAGPPR